MHHRVLVATSALIVLATTAWAGSGTAALPGSGTQKTAKPAKAATAATKPAQPAKSTTPAKANGPTKIKSVEWPSAGFFPIGVWFFNEDDSTYTGKRLDSASAQQYYTKAFDDLGAHGINTAFLNWIPSEHSKMALDAAAARGVKCVVHLTTLDQAIGRRSCDVKELGSLVKTESVSIKGHSALLAYYIKDEPVNTSEMANSVHAAKWAVSNIDATRPGLCCVAGRFDNLTEVARDPVLLANVYPIASNGRLDVSGYTAEADRLMKAANGRPLWMVVQAFGKIGAWGVPTPVQIEEQVWLSLVSGAKGIVYFIYQSTGAAQGEHLQGLTDSSLEATDDRWTKLTDLNKTLAAIGPTVSGLIPSKADAGLDLPSSLIWKRFTDKAGMNYLIVANTNLEESVTLNAAGANAVDVATGQAVSAETSIAPGSGMLLKLGAAPAAAPVADK